MNLKLFKKRLNDLYICWRKYNKDLWGNSDVLVIQTPSSNSSPNHCNPISSFFYFWLMGHDFPDTIAVFTRDEIHFICNKKVSILQTLVVPAMEVVKAQVLIHVREKGDDGLTMMDNIIRSVRVMMYNDDCDPHESRPIVVGYISGESPKSKLLWTCIKMMKPMEFRSAPVNFGLSKLSKVFNHADHSLGNSKVESRSHGNGKDIQMQSLPDDFDQRLSLGSKIKPRVADQLVPKIEENELALEKENGGLGELRGDSSKYCLVSEEEDEWVLIEADEEEHQIGSNKKGVLGWTKYTRTEDSLLEAQ